MALNWLAIGLTLAILLIFGTAYALLVRWMAGNHIEGQTAYLVAFGVLVTVLASTAPKLSGCATPAERREKPCGASWKTNPGRKR